MPSYLVETYLRHGAAGECGAHERRARCAAEELTRAGIRVRFDSAVHVPEDEICLLIVDAPTGRQASLVAQRAGLEPYRVVEAVSSSPGADT